MDAALAKKRGFILFWGIIGTHHLPIRVIFRL
jgi:hypothetical protein